MLTKKHILEINKDKIIKMFTEELLSLEIIANVFNGSRMGIKLLLNRYGIDTSKKVYKVNCKVCSNIFFRNKKRINRNNKLVGNFCSQKCYFDYLNSNSIYNEPSEKPYGKRQAQRISRDIIKNIYGKLPKDSVVHHIDGNEYNYQLNNLLLLDSQKSHLMIHRGYGIPIILFDGRNHQ